MEFRACAPEKVLVGFGEDVRDVAVWAVGYEVEFLHEACALEFVFWRFGEGESGFGGSEGE